MTEGQQAMALICALIGQGVRTDTIYDAVSAVCDLPLGSRISSLAGTHDEHLTRAFAQEQVMRMGRGR